MSSHRDDLPIPRNKPADKAIQKAPLGPASPWTGYSADLRDPEFADFRASDADRSRAADVLSEAYAEGRIRHFEYQTRLDQAMEAGTLGELRGLIVDVALPDSHSSRAATPARPGAPVPDQRGSYFTGMATKISWGAWAFLAVMFNLIWILSGGPGRDPYWPMWPMFGTAIPAFLVSWILHLVGLNPLSAERRELRAAKHRRQLERLEGKLDRLEGRERPDADSGR